MRAKPWESVRKNDRLPHPGPRAPCPQPGHYQRADRTALGQSVAKRAASLGHFYNWLFISPEILSVFMLLVTKQKLIFHQLGRVSFLKNESLCLLARQFYPEAWWLQSGKENYGP